MTALPTLIEARDISTREQAVEHALDWATGRRSWTNLGPFEPYTPDVIAVMDAQEVVKWAALAQVLPSRAALDGEQETGT